MNASHHESDPSSLRTRESLIARLRHVDNGESWQEFYDLYEKLIRGLAIKCGLNQEEASEVVQETMITVANMLEGYEYDRQRCSFRSWIFHKARWRIADQLRKRPPRDVGSVSPTDSGQTSTVERVADPQADELDRQWDEEWREDLARRAMNRIKNQVSPRQFQIFDLYVVKGLPVSDVKRMLSVSALQVYLAKHRISGLLRKEIERLETRLG